jgi:arsenical resistance protein ArsH
MHPKVQELRELSKWSDGHVWVSPEQHGNLVSPPLDSLDPGKGGRASRENVKPGLMVTTRTCSQTGVFKQQIDWIPLTTGSVRPTQGRTLAVAQVCGGSQSFNAVNSLRILGRWMRMFTIPNQSSVPRAYTQFTPEAEGSRMMAGPNRDRLVDCMEELVKYTIVMRPHFEVFGDRFSEREESRAKKAEKDGKKEAGVS